MAKRRFQIRLFPDPADVSRAASASIAALARSRVKKSGRFTLVLAGGSTPRLTYALLASAPLIKALPWAQMFFYFGDERHVPPGHPDSNYGMVRQTLLRDTPIPPENVFPIPTDKEDPAACADAYEELLRAHFPGVEFPSFDLMLLGVGADGHTASIFPRTPALTERKRWVVWCDPTVSNPDVKPAVKRITLTPPVICHAAKVFTLVTGEEKAMALSGVLSAEVPAEPPAARLLRECENRVTFFLDVPAAESVQPLLTLQG